MAVLGSIYYGAVPPLKRLAFEQLGCLTDKLLIFGIALGPKFDTGIVADPKNCGRTVKIDGDRIGFDDIGEDFDGIAYGLNRCLRCRGGEKCEIDNSYADCGNRKR